MPFVNVNGITLFYDEYGDGDEVIISAQQGFANNSYQEMLAVRGFHVFNITLRGYGKSTHIFEDLGTQWYPTWSNDVRSFAKLLGIERFIYTGVSHGAGVGWQIARDEPGVLKAFISIVGAPHDRSGGEVSEARSQTIKLAESKKNQCRSPMLFMVPTTDPLRIKRREQFIKRWEGINANFSKEELLINPRKPFPDAKTNEDLFHKLSEINVPTLLICGCQDDIISAEMSLLAAKAVPCAKTIFYQDHSHILPTEMPEIIVEDILLFLNNLKSVFAKETHETPADS